MSAGNVRLMAIVADRDSQLQLQQLCCQER